jgi:hypothetical protein
VELYSNVIDPTSNAWPFVGEFGKLIAIVLSF